VAASHTSGTDMGTDWRDNDAALEPAVEIYQGDRQNYEMPGAPRTNSAEDSIGGWRPLGFVSLALDGAGTSFISYRGGGTLKFASAEAPPAVMMVPGGGNLPRSSAGNGLYDDVNGNGRGDFADVVLYFNQMAWIAANEPLAPFDYNANGRIDFADVVRLFDRL
jgi:PKD repeat protein